LKIGGVQLHLTPLNVLSMAYSDTEARLASQLFYIRRPRELEKRQIVHVLSGIERFLFFQAFAGDLLVTGVVTQTEPYFWYSINLSNLPWPPSSLEMNKPASLRSI
jgi:hypothetical protein